MKQKEPEWMERFRAAVEKAKANPRVPKRRWRAWGLFFKTLFSLLSKMVELRKGKKVVRELEKINAERDAERRDRILNPEKYRGK